MRQSLPSFLKRHLAALAVSCALLGAARAEPPVRLPPGTRADASGQYISGRGLRESTDFLARQIDKAGIVVTKIGPYRVRGVEITRFVSQTPSTPWLAIHVTRSAGKTAISFVPRPPS